MKYMSTKDPDNWYKGSAIDGTRIRKMSNLDIVSLNTAYPPCMIYEYHYGMYYGNFCAPSEGLTVPLMYCGRVSVFPQDPDMQCGPNSGPNCPTCRSIANPKIVKLLFKKKGKSEMRWQGSTGKFYCGKQKTKYSFCGPHDGEPCSDCKSILLYGC